MNKHMVELPVTNRNESIFVAPSDGCRLFIYDFRPYEHYHASIFVIASITGEGYNANEGTKNTSDIFFSFC